MLQESALPGHYLSLASVFDGVRGQPHGGRASSAAAKYLAQLVRNLSLPLASQRSPNVELEETYAGDT